MVALYSKDRWIMLMIGRHWLDGLLAEADEKWDHVLAMNPQNYESTCKWIFHHFQLYEIPVNEISWWYWCSMIFKTRITQVELIIEHPRIFLLDTLDLVNCIGIKWAPDRWTILKSTPNQCIELWHHACLTTKILATPKNKAQHFIGFSDNIIQPTNQYHQQENLSSFITPRSFFVETLFSFTLSMLYEYPILSLLDVVDITAHLSTLINILFTLHQSAIFVRI